MYPIDNAIIKHAEKHVWCAPDQDHQHVIKLARLTPKGGVLLGEHVLWDYVKTPEPQKRGYYHYYQVGGLPTSLFDIIEHTDRWLSYAELNAENNLLIDVYFASGAIVPRDKIWLTKLSNNNVVLALKVTPSLNYGASFSTNYAGVAKDERFSLDNDQLYVRFYSNAYFDSFEFSESAIDVRQPIQHIYQKILSESDYTRFMNQCRACENRFGEHGGAVYYRDGFVVNKPAGYNVDMLGVQLSFMWDESVIFDVTYPLSTLPSYVANSNRGLRKYLIVTDIDYSSITYHDDVDFYIINQKTGMGVYYNKTADVGISMVTNNAYSLNAEVVDGYINIHPFLGKIADCGIRVVARQGGRRVGLLGQKNRIEQLYKLSYPQIVNAMVNTQSVLDLWRAANLEEEAYIKLIGVARHNLTKDLVVSAYGYNGLLNAFAKPYSPVKSRIIEAPMVTTIVDRATNMGVRTVFLYDQFGKYIGYENDSLVGNEVLLNSKRTAAVHAECFNFTTDTLKSGIYLDQDVMHSDLEQYGFRCYVSPIKNGVVTNDWDDITGTPFYTYAKASKISGAKVVWNWALLDSAGLYPALKTQRYCTVYKKKLTRVEGSTQPYIITPKANITIAGSSIYGALVIPPAKLDVFIDGNSLIEDIDYVVDYPNIHIINRDINQKRNIDIAVRQYGCARASTNKHIKAEETGFIVDGKLSINGVYDIRNDSSVRIIVDGKFIAPNTIVTGESSSGSNDFKDGAPYSISGYALPMENLTSGGDTYALYEESKTIDKQVSDYLTPRIKELNAARPVVIETRYVVLSTIISTMINDFLSGVQIDADVGDKFTSAQIESHFAPYRKLLSVDPAALNVTADYFRIEPHSLNKVVTLTQKQYALLEWINKLHLNNRVDLSFNVAIGE